MTSAASKPAPPRFKRRWMSLRVKVVLGLHGRGLSLIHI